MSTTSFLQVMDHGKLTDHNGRQVDFRNVILIMTSNAGAAEQAKSAIGFGRDRRTGEDTAAIERTFTPEFRNRLDAVISFAPLSRDIIIQVVDKFVLQLEAQLMDRHVHIELTPEAANWLAEKGYDDRMGARPLGRVIQEHIKEAARRGASLRQADEGRARARPCARRVHRARGERTRQAPHRRIEAAASDGGLTNPPLGAIKAPSGRVGERDALPFPPVLNPLARMATCASGGSIWTKMKRMRFHLGPNTPGVSAPGAPGGSAPYLSVSFSSIRRLAARASILSPCATGRYWPKPVAASRSGGKPSSFCM